MCWVLILADIRPIGISFHAVVIFGLGKNLLFKSILGRCGVPVICFLAAFDNRSDFL